MKKLYIAIVFAALYFGSAIPPASADGNTYKRVVCSPADYNEGNSSKCVFKYKLKKLQTKEFRGHCAYADSAGEMKTYKPKSQDCRKNNSANSCTRSFDASTADPTKKYQSCSCTNWDLTNSHNVKVMINC